MTDSPANVEAVKEALADFKDPETGRSALQLEQISDITLSENELTLTLALTTWAAPIQNEVCRALEDTVRGRFPQLTSVSVKRETLIRPPEKLGDIGLTAKNVLAVGSGKGGVGKSTVAANIALGLKRAGAQVGLMDADVYGPSIPHLLGLSGQPYQENNQIHPIESDGMPVMSMGFLVPPGEAVVWRGPMLHQYVTAFLGQTRWGDLDYLVIDMPPGTGDVALSLSQLLPLTDSVVVCTPQDVALLDAVKAIAMFRKVNINILGMVENMSGFVCPDCNKRFDIFGRGGARQKAEELGVPFLGDVPINMQIRELGDTGKTAGCFDEASVAPYFQQIVSRMVKQLAERASADPQRPKLPVL